MEFFFEIFRTRKKSKCTLYIYLVYLIIGGYSIPYFIKDHLFTKTDLLNRIENIAEGKYYLPDIEIFT